MSLEVRLDRRVLLVATLPVFLLLAAINLAAGWLGTRAHFSGLQDFGASVAQAMDRRLAGEVLRLNVIAQLPAARATLKSAGRGSSKLVSGASEYMTPDEWRALSRDDLRVREVLDNSVSDTLRNVAEATPAVLGILLTDASGRLLAATAKPDRSEFGDADWWSLAKSQPAGRAAAKGPGSDGTITLALPVYFGGETSRILRGVISAEIAAPELATGLLPGSEKERSAVVLLGDGAIPVWGSQDVFGTLTAGLEATLRKSTHESGSFKGLRFSRQPLGFGLAWVQPASVITIRNDGSSGTILHAMLLALVIISILLAVIWDKTCRRFLNRMIVNPHAELFEAGDWILRTALGRPSLLASPSAHVALEKQVHPEVTPLQKELQKWLHRLLQDLQDDYASQTYEMQRDLSLARDFQQAYIDRAYPKVPAVHVEGRLRLDFYHRYQPALALGGDFYNILTLASDCAGVFISDVMGHGTRSALITAIMRTLIDDLAPQGRNARHFLTEMNRLFCGLLKSVPSPLFASAFYFVADTTARVATYSSAGHPSPFHVRRSVARVSRLDVPMPRGAALGMIPNEKYTGGYCRLIDGDVYLFFTDGVYEAHNVHGEEFGIARMEEVLRKLMYKSAKEMADGIMDAVTTFVEYEPLADDICIVAVEVTTKV